MQLLADLLAWRAKQCAAVLWLAALAIFLIAFIGRWLLGTLHGANPSLTFYPAILVATVAFGWPQATLVLFLSVLAGGYFFLQPGQYLQPAGWLVIGGFNIAIIAGLQSMTRELAAANERQRLLFQELQHRVANTFQAVVSTFQVARWRLASSPDEAAALLDEAAHRISAAADVHRRLHDPALFEQGLEKVLADAIGSIIDHQAVRLHLHIEPLGLSFDQMSTLAMLVIEAANNAQKHVFQPGRGTAFSASLRPAGDRMATLAICDDGPGPDGAASEQPGLGTSIIAGLARQLGGNLSIQSEGGHRMTIEFPLRGSAP